MIDFCRLAHKHSQLSYIVGITRCPDFRYNNGSYGYRHSGGVCMYVLLAATSVSQDMHIQKIGKEMQKAVVSDHAHV